MSCCAMRSRPLSLSLLCIASHLPSHARHDPRAGAPAAAAPGNAMRRMHRKAADSPTRGVCAQPHEMRAVELAAAAAGLHTRWAPQRDQTSRTGGSGPHQMRRCCTEQAQRRCGADSTSSAGGQAAKSPGACRRRGPLAWARVAKFRLAQVRERRPSQQRQQAFFLRLTRRSTLLAAHPGTPELHAENSLALSDERAGSLEIGRCCAALRDSPAPRLPRRCRTKRSRSSRSRLSRSDVRCSSRGLTWHELENEAACCSLPAATGYHLAI